jgi:hypothetical protein
VAGETIVFFGKYTSLCGSGSGGTAYPSDPYDVTSYKTVNVETYFADGTAGSAVSAQAQGSSDLITWTDLGSAMAPSVGALASVSLSNPPRYVRVVATVTSTDDVVTLWVKAVCRES